MNDDDVRLVCLDDVDDCGNYIIWIGPEDNTQRPPSPEVLKAGLKAREEIAQWEAWKKEREKQKKLAQDGKSGAELPPTQPNR